MHQFISRMRIPDTQVSALLIEKERMLYSMNKFVYQLRANGRDFLTGSQVRVITSSTCFDTFELADSRVEKFRTLCIEARMLMGPIDISVVPLEVITNAH